MEYLTSVAAVIHTYNEEEHLESCIDSVRDIAQEIIVADMGSTDSTLEIADRLGATIYGFEWHDNPDPIRNYVHSFVKTDYIYLLDPDERSNSILNKKLLELAAQNTPAVWIPRKNMMFGKWIKSTPPFPDYQCHFFKKGYTKWPETSKKFLHQHPLITGKSFYLPPEEQYAKLHLKESNVGRILSKHFNHATSDRIPDFSSWNTTKILSYLFDGFPNKYFNDKTNEEGLAGFIIALLENQYHLIDFIKYWESKGFIDILDSEIVRQEISKIYTKK